MIYLIKHYYIQTIDKRRILITSVRRILEIPGIHKSLLKEITYMWYGRRRTLLATVTSSLHSVQIMAKHLVLLITLARLLEDQMSHKSHLKEIMCMLYGQRVLLALISFTQQTMRTFGLFGSALNLSHNPESGFSQSPQISSSP